MGFIKNLFSKKEKTRSPDRCYKCNKSLRATPGSFMGTGSELVSFLSSSPYNCKSCDTAFCVDCMSIMKKGNRRCAYCGNDIGW